MTEPVEESDEALIERANRGDDDAFEALYRRHRDWVIALAYRMTGNREDALDVLQDAFAYFFAKFPGFALTAQLKTFLYPAVKHLCLSRIRRRVVTVDIADLAERLPAGADPGAGLSDLRGLLAALPEPQREVVLMRFVDDMSLQQIADALGVPLGTVKSRLHNAIDQLRKRA